MRMVSSTATSMTTATRRAWSRNHDDGRAHRYKMSLTMYALIAVGS
jgi:hypothetical protein